MASRLLVISFALPPIGVQMSPVAARVVAELVNAGFVVDVVSASTGVCPLPVDDSLSGYLSEHAASVVRLESGRYIDSYFVRRLLRLIDIPDPMITIVVPGLACIIERGSERYDTILSISPFHSVNTLAEDVKKRWQHIPWIACFYDPWAHNPLETRKKIEVWNGSAEASVFCTADRIVQSSRIAIQQIHERYPGLAPGKLRHVRHTFDSHLYPRRERAKNDCFTFRFVGTLFGRRSPEPLIAGLKALLERQPKFRSAFAVELVGSVEPGMRRRLATSTLASMVKCRPAVSYRRSLELMYDADALLLIEADVPDTPFMPSKLTDYLGADTPVLGIVPRGECRDVLTAIGAPVHDASDVEGIAASIEAMVERSRATRATWCDQDMRRSFDLRVRQDGLAAIVREVCGA